MKPTIPSDENVCFASAVLPYLDDVYELARWLAGNRVAAEDIVQEACLSAVGGVDRFAGGNARSRALMIVRHTAYQWLQRNRPAAIALVGDLESVAGVGANRPHNETRESTLSTTDDSGQLEAMIAALPAPLREAIVLCDLQGLSYREIAEVTEMPINTVMLRLAQARGRLLATIVPREAMATS